MSGKSTYIRAIAMLQIMAQVGCYIPAESARMPILFNLFARVSTDDLLEANLSTFSIEMREMAFILRYASCFTTSHAHFFYDMLTHGVEM